MNPIREIRIPDNVNAIIWRQDIWEYYDFLGTLPGEGNPAQITGLTPVYPLLNGGVTMTGATIRAVIRVTGKGDVPYEHTSNELLDYYGIKAGISDVEYPACKDDKGQNLRMVEWLLYAV